MTKVTLVILLGAFTCSGAATYAQRASIQVDNVPLEEVFSELRRQTGFHFLYLAEDLKNAGRVSLDVQDVPLEDILHQCLADQDLHFTIRKNRVLIEQRTRKPVNRQQMTIVGHVTDSQGQPLPGVAVSVKATSTSTMTDEAGNYEIDVPGTGVTLVYGMLGFNTREIEVGQETNIDVSLEEAFSDLEEVVVVAFGQQKKVSLTGAVSTLTTRELRQSPVANLSNALAGRMPGLITFQPSGEPGNDLSQLYIRGVSTFSDSAPLVVVDGILGRDFAQLDPNEVESITILKDASATAVYGVRGANGVILVTTRRGTASDRPQINFSTELGFQSPTRLPDYLDSYDYARLFNEALANDNLPPRYSEEDLEFYRIGADPYLYANTDWLDEFLRPQTPMFRTNLNINGGGDKVLYFVSASALTQNGMYKHSDQNEYNTNARFNRYNFRSNIDINLTSDFTVGLDLAGRVENRNYPGRDTWLMFEILNKIPPTYPVHNPDGSLAGDNLNPENPMGLIAGSGYRDLYGNFIQGTYRMAHQLDFITEGLSARAAFAFDGAFDYNIIGSRDYAVYQLREDGGYNQYRNDTELGISKNYSYNRTVNLEGALEYNRSVGDHQVTGLLLVNQNRRVVHNDSYNIPFTYLGYVSRITYNFKDKLFGEVNMGYNGSEQFPKGERFGFFPSMSLGWVLTEEPFMANTSRTIDFLKIRGSYGEVGNDRFGARRFLYQQTFQASAGYHFGANQSSYEGFAEGPLANTSITWERARKTNAGLELGLWNSQLLLTSDFFHERRDNILTTRGTVSNILGRSGNDLPPVNIGVVRNRGVDMELTYRNRAGSRVNISFSGNFTYARNKVLFMDEENRPYDYQYRTGQRVGQTFGLVATGFFDSYEDINNSPRHAFVSQESLRPGDIKYMDVNEDGVIDANDEVPIGYNLNVPEVMFGLSGRVSYKGFDFSVLLQGAARSSVLMDNFPVWEFRGGSGKVVRWHLDRWTPETAETATYPRLFVGDNHNNQRLNSFWMRPRDYLRVKNIELGYTFTGSVIRKLLIRDLRVYTNAFNLLTWDKVKIADPELPAWSGNNSYPQQRVINFGLSANF